MHTAICTFEDRATADQAVERLVQSGFDRQSVHVQYRNADGSSRQPNDAWDSMEREVAVDRGVVERLGDFFTRLFGQHDPSPHRETYRRAVELGYCVVVVDAADDAEAERAQSILHGMEARDMNLVQRAGQRPLREIVADRQDASDLEQSFGTAREDMAPSHNMDVRGEGEFPRERAMASQGWGEQRKLEVVDEDQPIASPDLGGDKDGKPS